MLLREIQYARPASLREAVHLLSDADARALAGGQSLINVLKLRLASPTTLVDVGGLPGLAYIRLDSDGSLELGANTTYDEIENSQEVRKAHPVLAEVAAHIADQQVRNRGTVGGNCCFADPANNFPPVMVALDARFKVAGAQGDRWVAAEDFFLGPYRTAVAPGELLTAIQLPARRAGEGFAALRVHPDGWAIVQAAASVHLNGRIQKARVVLGCVAGTPVRARVMEERLADQAATAESVRKAATGLGESLEPPSDMHASSDYRRQMAAVFAARAVMQAVADARRG
jgi:aerobic carbon-monoxide dehydrogenase medium subunit